MPVRENWLNLSCGWNAVCCVERVAAGVSEEVARVTDCGWRFEPGIMFYGGRFILAPLTARDVLGCEDLKVKFI